MNEIRARFCHKVREEYFRLNSEILHLHKFAIAVTQNDYCKQPVIR